MQNSETEQNTKPQLKTSQLTLDLGIPESTAPKFRSKFSALIAQLPNKELTDKEYKAECGIIKQIIKRGIPEKKIYAAWVFYKESRGQKFTSYSIFLWKDCKLIKDVLPLLNMKKDDTKVKISDTDFREPVEIKKKQKFTDFAGPQPGEEPLF